MMSQAGCSGSEFELRATDEDASGEAEIDAPLETAPEAAPVDGADADDADDDAYDAPTDTLLDGDTDDADSEIDAPADGAVDAPGDSDAAIDTTVGDTGDAAMLDGGDADAASDGDASDADASDAPDGDTSPSCTGGGTCDPSTPCKTGSVVCSGGVGTCVPTGNRADGTSCGVDKVCVAGVCVGCVAGSACTPAAACKAGATSCAGAPTCVPTTNLADGTSCGAGRVCSGGSCVDCAAGASCTPPGVKCKAGAIQCDMGPVCAATANLADGTTCGTDQVCKSGSCVSCTAGVACAPAGSPCKSGTTSCSTGDSVCIAGANLPNGTSCGTDKVCSAGACVSCTAGTSCSIPTEPCKNAATSCSTGTSVCTATTNKSDGTVCGASGTGKCSGGACACPPGSGFVFGDCAACPALTNANTLHVDAVIGTDDACCGAKSTAGFGGPCKSVGYAMDRVGGSGWTLLLRGDATNVMTAETYPIVLKNGVQLNGWGDYAVFPGVAGKDVFVASSSGGAMWKVEIGHDGVGASTGAKRGVYLPPGTSLKIDAVYVRKTEIGVEIDGGYLAVGGLGVNATSGDGVVCRSSTDPTKTSTVVPRKDVAGAPQLSIDDVVGRAFYAGKSCSAIVSPGPIQLFVNQSSPCATKKTAYGLWAEEDANLVVGGSTLRCFSNDGISLHGSAGAAPSVTFDSVTVTGAGCSGALVAAGKLTVPGAFGVGTSHWGIVQESDASSSAPSSSLFALSSASVSFACNGKGAPGACCTSGSCPNGGDVFNHSGLPLDLKGATFTQSPLAICNCNASLASCTCSGFAFGSTTPPDGISVLNAPKSAGTPTTDTTGYKTSTVTCPW